MNYTEHKITLDTHKIVSPVSLCVKKGDTGRRLLIHLSERGYPYHISADCYAVFTAKKPDGNVVFNECRIKDCVIIYDFTAQTVAAVGLMECEIILYGADGKQITSASFNIIVEDTIYDAETEVESDSEFNALASLIAQVQEIKARSLATPPIINEADGEVISMPDASNSPLQGLRIFGKSTQNGDPTPDNPVEIVSVGDGGTVEVSVCGKNLLKNKATTKTVNGVTFTVNDDKSVTINGTATNTADFYIIGSWHVSDSFLGTGADYILTGTKDSNVKVYGAYDASLIVSMEAGEKEEKFTNSVGLASVFLRVEAGVTVSNLTYYPMIRSASVTDDTYEPYTAQTIAAQTPNGLPGIPVTSGGNYTDGDGQQWICDEVDLTRGVYVQRVNVINPSVAKSTYMGAHGFAIAVITTGAKPPLDGTVVADVLCSHAVRTTANKQYVEELNTVSIATDGRVLICIDGITTNDGVNQFLTENDVYIFYPLATPIETALTDAEITAYEALCTSYPNTTIYNDAGAYMSVRYVADTKTYVDNHSSAGSAMTISTVTLLAANWVGANNLYSQVVAIDGVTENSQVNLAPTVEQMAVFYEKDLTFVTENDGGVVTVYVIGQKPENDYTIQADIVEVVV